MSILLTSLDLFSSLLLNWWFGVFSYSRYSDSSVLPKIWFSTILNTLLRCLGGNLSSLRQWFGMQGSLSFIVLFIIYWAVHELSSHSLGCHPLQGLSQHICPHVFSRAVNNSYLSVIHLIFDKEELRFNVFCFLSTWESSILHQKLCADVFLIQTYTPHKCQNWI